MKLAGFVYSTLKKEYGYFQEPQVAVTVNGLSITAEPQNLGISDVEVEMSSGFEAGIATFWIFNCYDRDKREFKYTALQKYIMLGSSVQISLGYGGSLREVFRGFIAKVNFAFRRQDIPGVEITAMDAKGIMMANNYSKQLTKSYYSDAVTEILNGLTYQKLRATQIITDVKVSATPDKPGAASGGTVGVATAGGSQGASDRTIEMVCESDYEFIVKAAKKFNYEFFVHGGVVLFRKAKENQEILIELDPTTGIRSFNVEYDITGLVNNIEVRGLDVGKAKLITARKKANNKISLGAFAKPLIAGSKKVYIDPTTESKQDADYRAEYLLEDMSYRLGTLEAELNGLPELVPGRFIKLTGLGMGASNTFYLVTVRHILAEDGYITKITGKAASMETMASLS